jgi:hypothetical protein
MQAVDQVALHPEPSVHTNSAVSAYIYLIDTDMMRYRDPTDAMYPSSCMLACCAGELVCACAPTGIKWLQAMLS